MSQTSGLQKRERVNNARGFFIRQIFSVLFFFAIFLGSFFIFGTGQASAATYYVDNLVTNTNVGSATPDLNKALNLNLKIDGKLGSKTVAVIKKW